MLKPKLVCALTFASAPFKSWITHICNIHAIICFRVILQCDREKAFHRSISMHISPALFLSLSRTPRRIAIRFVCVLRSFVLSILYFFNFRFTWRCSIVLLLLRPMINIQSNAHTYIIHAATNYFLKQWRNLLIWSLASSCNGSSITIKGHHTKDEKKKNKHTTAMWHK